MKKPKEPKSARPKAQAQPKDKATAAVPDAARKAVARPRRRNIEAVIKKLDVSTLQEDQLSELLVHVASSLNLRKALDNPALALPRSSSGLCYTKSGDSDMVSLWRGPFKEGETTEASAQARGIPPCG
ncbi:hypothetical protein C3Y94_028110 [Rhizobium ruizarguesonis]|uniref:hypothetical protein n=1 Tax=Rhizobium ruizarguesonis TaxID=2081791 RepID=UPI00163AE0AB|nr:hypothetical protein [Rhizobium ruizarguesonis]MBC2806998.1 hypothetical protein [Rhizobium ruizarguesonis]